jgi:calcium/calmodulin-dependent protein kinase IV
MVHRDIKLENIMMSDNSNTASIKLVDFGLAKIIGHDCKTKEPFGTVGYCAPEILLGQSYSLNCDLWSVGCLIYAMVCESLPFDSDNERKTIQSTCQDELVFDCP